MPRERQFYDAAAAEDEEGEREWSGENGRREKLLTDREGGREGGRTGPTNKSWHAFASSSCLFASKLVPPLARTCSDWANRTLVSSRSLTRSTSNFTLRGREESE